MSALELFIFLTLLLVQLTPDFYFPKVPEDCCSEDGKKWGSIFKGVTPGKVCCNAPCKDGDTLQCAQPGRCNQRSLYSSKYIAPQDYGFGGYTSKKHSYGSYYPSLYSTIDNSNDYQVTIIFAKRKVSITTSGAEF